MNDQPDVDLRTDVAIDDEAADDTSLDVLPTYTILSYGVDFDVTSLVKRMENEDIDFPNFQRGFIWESRRCARFIESLLLGFPVPGIFLWRNPRTERLSVVDGQQRLRTLKAYYAGVLRGREFSLPERTAPYQVVHPRFQKKTYRTLEEEDRRRLDNSIIHATIVNQESPPEDDTSIFYLFERINTEGTPLQPQEIRSAIYQGDFVNLLGRLNGVQAWREIFGPESRRLKDQELIVRFFALFHSADTYQRPMKEFLNRYFRDNRDLAEQSAEELTTLFGNSIETIHAGIGPRAFRPERVLNAAVYDAIMVGVAHRIRQKPIEDLAALKRQYDTLLGSSEFVAAHTRATADRENVHKRLDLATTAFADVV